MTDQEQVSLKEYFESRLSDYKAAHRHEHEAMRVALEKAEMALTAKLESMNEFRSQLNEQKSTFATKEQMQPLLDFHQRLFGFLAGLTIFNAIVTTLIVFLLQTYLN